MACWKRLHLQFRPRWTSGRTSKSSDGRKIARMARNSTIFGPNESSRRDLFLEKFSKERNKQKVFEKFKKQIENCFKKFFVGFFLGNIKDSSLAGFDFLHGSQQVCTQHGTLPLRNHCPENLLAEVFFKTFC